MFIVVGSKDIKKVNVKLAKIVAIDREVSRNKDEETVVIGKPWYMVGKEATSKET